MKLMLSALATALVILQSQQAVSQLPTPLNTVFRTNGTSGDVLNNTVVLGALIPVHGSGTPCGAVCLGAVQLVEAMVLAIDIINEDPSLLPNIKLAFDIRDSCLMINYALQQSLDYIQNSGDCSQQQGQGVSAVIGAARSTVSEATANLFGLFEVPQISYASTATIFSEDRFSFFFRTTPADNFQARAMVDMFVMFEWEYVILLRSDDQYGLGGAEAIRMEIEKRNATRICIAAEITVVDDPNNYNETVDNMNQAFVNNATVAVLFGHETNAIGVLEALKAKVREDPEYPLQNLTWIGSDSWGNSLDEEFLPLAQGMLSTVPKFQTIERFDEYFTSLDPINNTADPWFIEYWERVFSCNLGRSPNFEDCTVDNQTIDATNYNQVANVALVFDAVFALAHSIEDMAIQECGPTGTLCSDIVTNGVVNGPLLREYLLNVTLPSQSQNGNLSFDANGDVGGSYSVLNLQQLRDGQFSFEPVGSWDPVDGLVFKRDIEWVTGDQPPQTFCSVPCSIGEISAIVADHPSCCFTCEACLNSTAVMNNRCTPCGIGMQPNQDHSDCELIPITFLTWTNPWAIVLTILTSMGVVTTVFVIVVFLVFYKHELIKASSRELSAILLVGLLFCFIVPFFYIAKPSAAICGIRRFSLGFCFAVSYSALLVKTNRIYRIFSRQQNPSAKPLMFISPLSQVLITLAFLSVQVVIGIIWLAVEIPATEVVPSSTSNELTCASSPVTNLIVALAYNLFLLILCTYFAFLARKVPENFNEAKFINVTMYSTCLIWVVFIPTFFATSELGTIFQTTTLAFGVIFSATTALVCLFLSKVVLLSSRIREQRKTESSDHTQTGANALSTIPAKYRVTTNTGIENSNEKLNL
jgi:ABC-type branched-subunit amino acid transport system substrate-binding protein